jgi:peptidoglycan/LPS O-acetylase OafA/YrhL
MQTLRLLLVLSVVLHHAALFSPPGSGLAVADSPGAWLGRLLAESLAGVRIPLLFAAAGFLFFRHGPLPAGGWRGRWQSRLRSLALPLLLWTALTGLALWAAQTWPPTAGWFQGAWPRWSSREGLWGHLDLLLGWRSTPWVYPLWFLRDLCLMCILAPGLQWGDRRGRWLLPLLLCALAGLWWRGSDSARPVSPDAAFFFVLGATIGLRGLAPTLLRAVDRAGPWLAAPVLALALWRASWPAGLLPWPWDRGYALAAMAVLLWLPAVPRLARAVGPAAQALGPWAFFLFLTHEPLLSAWRRLLLSHGPAAPDPLPTGGLAVAGTVAVCALAWQVLARWAPGLLAALSGGRSRPPSQRPRPQGWARQPH